MKSHRINILSIEETPLDTQFKRFWETEKYGTKGAESKEDKYALDIVDKGTRKEPEYEETYRKAIQKYIDEGYAEKVTIEKELNHPKQWFLPHYGVCKK